jgi:FtsZ-interacting cell division protein ZipA
MKQHDDSSTGSFKSGGQRIDDHSFWAGKKGKDSVFPDGPHKTKDESSAEGSGSVMKYEDTTEAIKAAQVEGSKKVKAHQGKLAQYRN